MALVAHPSPPNVIGMQPGGHYGQLNGAAPVDAHTQRQRLLGQLNESTWQRIGKLQQSLISMHLLIFKHRLVERTPRRP